MRVRPTLARYLAPLPLLLTVLLAACSSVAATSTGHPTATTGGAGATATVTPAPCATRATAQGEAWDIGQQVVGTVNGGAVTTLSNFVYPLGIPDENAVGNTPKPSFITWSPDGTHLGVLIQQVVPFSVEYDPYVVDTSTHAVTKVPLPGALSVPSDQTSKRMLTWADNHTLIIMSGIASAPNVFSYDITTNTLSTLPGIGGAVEGVARCGVLYYLKLSAFSPLAGDTSGNHYMVASGQINRYDLTTHTAIGGAYTVGDATTFGGAEGQVTIMGWDVTRDGAKVAYQQTKATLTPGVNSGMTLVSHFFAANSDGSGATAILNGAPAATANSQCELAISPNGALVAVTDALPSPDVLTGSMSGGSPRAYTPDATGTPAWLADSSGFDASKGSESIISDVYRYLLSTPLNGAGQAPGSDQVPGGTLPATLP